MSKSQKRKQRLLNKGKAMVIATVPVQNVSNRAGKVNRRRRNRRNRNKGARMPPSGGAGSLYFNSLLKPDEFPGAKVPDLVAYPSGTFQLESYGILATGTGGDTVSIVCCPIIGDSSTLYPITTFNGAASGIVGAATNVNWTARSAVAAAFQLFRPVSGLLECYFIGNSTADAGRICGGLVVGNSVPGTYATIEALPDTEEWAMRNGMRVLWKPLDESTLGYSDVTPDPSVNRIPMMIIAATGLPSATASIAYRCVVNFEAIPTNSYYDLVETSASPYDPGALRKAFEWAAQAGNSVLQLAEKISPYVQTGYQLYRMGSSAVGGANSSALGWNPLPQREFRRRSRGLHFGVEALVGAVKASKSLKLTEMGKDEESEEDVEEQGETPGLHEALQSFSKMQVREKASSTEPMGPVIQSPGLSRFRKGQ